MIKPSPLKLIQYSVEEMHVVMRELRITEPTPVPYLATDDLDVNVEHFGMKEDANARLCRLQVKLRETDKLYPYRFTIRVVGIFQLPAEGLNPQQRDTFIRFSMPSVLWSTARETLAEMMSKGPYPPMVLPIVTFLPDQEPTDLLKGAGSAIGAHQVP